MNLQLSGWFLRQVKTTGEEFSQIINCDMSALRFQFFRVAFPRDADDQAEFPSHAGLNPGDRVLDHDGMVWWYSQHLSGFQKRVRRRLTGEVLFGEDIAVHARIK